MENASISSAYLQSVIKRFGNYKELGDKTFAQLEEKDLFYQANEESNSIAIIVQHISGNMLSRWTNFLTEDGEKNWRERDKEFEPVIATKKEMLEAWEKGWKCFLDALRSLQPAELLRTITIRDEPLVVIDAINRQLGHYPYHVGQIIFIAKLLKNQQWQSLSIPRKRG